MASPSDKAGKRRILMALEPAEAGEDIFESAVRLAEGLGAELEARMFSDIDPEREQPASFLRITTLNGRTRKLEQIEMRRAFRRLRRRHHELLARAAARSQVRFTFREEDAGTIEEWQREVKSYDLIAVVRSGPSGTGLVEAFRDIERACRDAACAVLVLPRGIPPGRPVLLDYTGDSESLALAVQLAGIYGSGLLITHEEDERDALLRALDGLNLPEDLRTSIRLEPVSDASGLQNTITRQRPGILVLSRKDSFFAEKEILRLAVHLRSPVLILP